MLQMGEQVRTGARWRLLEIGLSSQTAVPIQAFSLRLIGCKV